MGIASMSVLILTFLFILFSSSIVRVSGSEEACHQFSVGKCDPEVEVVLAIQHIPCTGVELQQCMAACQSICTVTARCNYFTYEESSADCYLMAQADHNGYLSTCAVLAGPAEPSLAECDSETPSDSCNLFVSEDCAYPGEVVYTSKDVVSPADCQVLLFQIGFLYEGDMFIHDSSEENLCEFRKTFQRECSGINGPVSPPLMNCPGEKTTPIPTTSTSTTPVLTTSTSTTSAPTTFEPTIPNYPTVELTFLTFNAVDNNVLPMVSINLALGEDAPVQSVTTDTNGQVVVTISNVNFPIRIEVNAWKKGFISFNGSFAINNEEPFASLTLSLTPELKPEQDYRLVMNWGHLPLDLDLHVIQISSSGSNHSCETYYNERDGCDGLFLDVDNTHGGDNGAETITWTEPGDNWYLLFVFDYSRDEKTLAQSYARLSFYAEDFIITEYVPEADPNTRSFYWVLGCFDGANAKDSFKLVNALEVQKPQISYGHNCQKLFD